MQKTGWTNYSSFLVMCGLEKGFHLRMWSLGGTQQPLSCVLCHCWHGDKHMNTQPGNPRASLLLNTEEAVFYKRWRQEILQFMDIG